MKKRSNDMINRIYIIRYLFTACSVYLFSVAEGHVKCLAISPISSRTMSLRLYPADLEQISQTRALPTHSWQPAMAAMPW